MPTNFDNNDDNLDALSRRIEVATQELEKLGRQFSSGGIDQVIQTALKKQERQLTQQMNTIVKDAIVAAFGGVGGAGKSSVLSSLLGVIPGFARGGVLSRSTPVAYAGEAGPEVVLPLKKGPDGRLGISVQGAKGEGQRPLSSSRTPIEVHIVGGGNNSGSITSDDHAALADAVVKALDDAIDHRLGAHLQDGGMLNGLNSSRMFRS